MTIRFTKIAAAFSLAALSAFAVAQDDLLETEPPGRVGRVALAQGKVSVSSGVGDTAHDALVNWPVTTRNLFTTASGARTELRIGSTSVRLDGDSALEVTELDDDSLRLRLHYGSAAIRIVRAEVAPEFELTTPHARVRMHRPGRLRVDAERVRDTTQVNVFDGQAQVEGAGASLLVRAGRAAEVRDDDVRTLQARRNVFDDWSLTRDKLVDGALSSRYVTTEMTGYEELDRHGSWRQDPEYGNLWIPSVTAGWAPYRDGRWTWIAPWGWTWVDNAPWGYAPFHYGRWVHVRNRWAWAPGRQQHPIWAPALVGWIGGAWNPTVHSRHPLPGQGWYPLGPHDHFVPGYRLSDERRRRLNNYGWRTRDQQGPDRRPDYRGQGLTSAPHVHPGQRGPIVVSSAPRPSAAPIVTPDAASVPPVSPDWRGNRERRRDGQDWDVRGGDEDDQADADHMDRMDRKWDERGRRRGGWDRDDRNRFGSGQRPPILSTHPQPSSDNAAATPFRPGRISTPAPAPLVMPVVPDAQRPIVQRHPERPRNWERLNRDERSELDGHEDRDRRGAFEARRERPQAPAVMPAPVVHAVPAPQFNPPSRPSMPPPQAIAPPPRAMAEPSTAAPMADVLDKRRAKHDDR